MKIRLGIILILVLLVGLFGCTQITLKITKYAPQDMDNINIETSPSFISDLVFYKLHSDPSFEINANIYEFNNILSLLISIKNKTGKDLEPSEYSISLVDGRDLKKIKMLTLQNLLDIRARYTGSKGAIQDQVIETTVSSALRVANVPTKEKLIELIDLGVNNYFSFRPIYSKETRQGVLCFIPSFKLEYPLGIMVKIKSNDYAFYFEPLPNQ